MRKTFFSTATSWIIRILLVIVFIVTVGLLMLSTLGGTSDSHRKGLEQAFSDTLKANVEVARIEEFNIMPQLSIKVDGVHGIYQDTKNEFMADKVKIAFSLADLATGKSRIEDFQLENFRFSADSEYDLQLRYAGIKPGKTPSFTADGRYGGRKFDMAVSILQDTAGRTAYYFDKANDISGHYGSLSVKGTATPSVGSNVTIVDDLKVMSGETILAEGKIIRENKIIKVMLNCSNNPVPAPVQDDFNAIQKMPFIVMVQGCSK